jgi:hypothetical protein
MKKISSLLHFPSFSLKEGSATDSGRQEWLTWLTIILILATFIYIGIQHRRINHLRDANQLQAVELSTLNDSVLVYKSKSGELTYKLSSVEIEKGNIKRSLELAGFDIKELRERDIAWRKITSALRMQLAATGSGETTVTDTFRIERIDTIYFQKVADWTNNNLSLFNAEIVNKKLNFDYRYTTGIDFLTSGTHKETVVSVILSDPNASITTANSITVAHKKRLWERGWLWAVVGFGTGVFLTR